MTALKNGDKWNLVSEAVATAGWGSCQLGKYPDNVEDLTPNTPARKLFDAFAAVTGSGAYLDRKAKLLVNIGVQNDLEVAQAVRDSGGDSRPIRSDSQTLGHLPQPSIPGPEHVLLAGGCPEQMHVNQPQPLPVKAVAVDEADDFGVGRLGGLRQGSEQPEDFRAPDERSARQFPDDERMADDVSLLQQGDRTVVATMQVVDPHRCVEEHHSARPPAGNGPQPRFTPATCRQFPSRLPGDQRLEAEPHQLRLLPNPGQSGGLRQGLLVDIECRSHAYNFEKRYAFVKARFGGRNFSESGRVAASSWRLPDAVKPEA